MMEDISAAPDGSIILLHGMYVLTQFTGIMEALMLGLLVAVPWS
jgi:hypothetical protein